MVKTAAIRRMIVIRGATVLPMAFLHWEFAATPLVHLDRSRNRVEVVSGPLVREKISTAIV